MYAPPLYQNHRYYRHRSRTRGRSDRPSAERPAEQRTRRSSSPRTAPATRANKRRFPNVRLDPLVFKLVWSLFRNFAKDTWGSNLAMSFENFQVFLASVFPQESLAHEDKQADFFAQYAVKDEHSGQEKVPMSGFTYMIASALMKNTPFVMNVLVQYCTKENVLSYETRAALNRAPETEASLSLWDLDNGQD